MSKPSMSYVVFYYPNETQVVTKVFFDTYQSGFDCRWDEKIFVDAVDADDALVKANEILKTFEEEP